MNRNQHLTRKQLIKETGARPYTISYLTETGRLPLVRPARGHGYPNLYHPDAVQVILEHLKLQQPLQADDSE